MSNNPYRSSRGSFSYPSAPRSPVSPGAVTYPGPGSRGSMKSLRSNRSDSGTWDQLVEAIISAEPVRDSMILQDEVEYHEPVIAEEAEEGEDSSSHPHSIDKVVADGHDVAAATEPGHQHEPSLGASANINGAAAILATREASFKRESTGESIPTTARASTVVDTASFQIDLRLNDNIDTTLRNPLKADVADEKPEPVGHDKEIRISRPGSQSGSSTVNEAVEDTQLSNNEIRPVDISDEEATASGESPSTAPFSAFPTKDKRLIVLGAASASIFAPLSMQIYLPSLTTLVTDFGVSRIKINLTVTVYMVFMAISPMILGGVADVVGRRPTMLLCFAVYMVSCVLIAMCHSYPTLMGFRILQSIGASPLIAIASAVVADIVTAAERGSYAALVAVPVIFAPTLGPVIGGLLTQYLGWRSVFWFLLVAGALGFVLIGTLFPETCRVIVGDASAKAPLRYRSLRQLVRDPRPDTTASATAETARLRGRGGVGALLWTSLTSAVRVLCTRERFLLLFYVGLIFSGFQAVATELPTQFKALYGFDSVMIGVMYLPLAGGAMISTVVFGKQMNRNFRRYAARAGINIEAGQEVDMNRVDVEKARLEITLPSLLLSTAGLICWGWVLEQKTSLAAPCVLLFVMGVGLNGVMATTNALLMDISQSQAGAVMAASNLTRCALGAVASAVIQLMIDKMGLGWTYVVFGAVFLALSPMLAVQYFKGHQWRMETRAKEDCVSAAKTSEDQDVEQALETRSVQHQVSGPEPELRPEPGTESTARSSKFRLLSSSSNKEKASTAAVDAFVGRGPAIPLVELANKEDQTST